MSKRERQLAASYRKVVNAVQNSDVKLFVKGSRVCSSKWSSADDSTPTHDNSHSHGRTFRGGGQRTHDFQGNEHEEMDTYSFNSWQAGNRGTVDNRQCSSELQSNGKHRNNQSSNRSGKDVFSSGGRPSVHGRSSFNGDHTVVQRGSSSHSRRSSSDWHGDGCRHSTSGGRSCNRSSGRYKPDNYSQNNLNGRS